MSNKPRYKIGEEVLHLKCNETGVIKEIDLGINSLQEEPMYQIDFVSSRIMFWVSESEIRYVSSPTTSL